MRCILRTKRELQLWVRAVDPGGLAVRVDGRSVDMVATPIGEGQRLTLQVRPGARRVELLVRTRQGTGSWSLDLEETGDPKRGAKRPPGRDVAGEVFERMDLVHRQLLARDLVGARTTLDDVRLAPKSPAESRYLVSFHRARLAESEGDYRSALAEVQDALKIAERVKPGRYVWLAEEELALLLRAIGRSGEAAELFARLGKTSYAGNACEEGVLLNNQAWSTLLAREAGEELPDPTPLLQRALARYQACTPANPGYRVNSMINLALAHLQEGRPALGEQLLAAARELEPHPTLPHLLWWLDLEGRIALDNGRLRVARGRFGELEKLAEGTGSADGRLRAAIGQARALRALDDAAEALAVLQRAETVLDEQSLQVPVHEGRETFLAARRSLVTLHVELLLDSGRPAEALAVARHARARVLRQLAHSDSLANLPVEARVRRAKLLSAYTQRRLALEARAAEDWKLPVDRLAHERAARQAEAANARDLLDSAFAVLGKASRREGGPLAAPRSGELLLVYHPLEGRRWVAFAADQSATTAHRFELPPGPLPPAGELSRQLLEPFVERVAAATRLRVVTSGELGGVDFQSLSLRGRPLLAYAPVVYGLDLPAQHRVEVASGSRVLLVADPRGDLPGARDEGRSVEQALAAAPRHWSLETLEAERAGVAAVQDELVDADLLHYAGHGSYSGLGGWDSSLLLAGDTRLTLGDLLALPRVPSWVVLAGCDTGRSADASSVASLGLAHAFLLAGAHAVVASTRVTYDRDMPRFFGDLYRQWDGRQDLAVALQRAQLDWRLRDPAADWASFRLFEP